MRVRPFHALVFLGFLFALIIAAMPAQFATAQGCYDKQGYPIPCPQPDQPRKKKPTKTPTLVPKGSFTATPTGVNGPQPYPQPYPYPYPNPYPGPGSGGGPIVGFPWWWFLVIMILAGLFLRPLFFRPPRPGPDPGPLHAEGELLPAVHHLQYPPDPGKGEDGLANMQDTEM